MENRICSLIVRLFGHLFKLIPSSCLSFAESVAPQHLDAARNALWMDALRSPLIRRCDVKAIILNFTPGIHNEAVKHDRKASHSAQAPTLHKTCSCFYEQKWSERNRSNGVPPAEWGMFVASLHLSTLKVWETRNTQVWLIVHKGGCHIGLWTQGCRGSSEFFRHEIPTSHISDDIVGRELWLLKVMEHTTSLKSPYKAEFVKTSFQNNTLYNTKTVLVNTHLLCLYFHFWIKPKEKKMFTVIKRQFKEQVY